MLFTTHGHVNLVLEAVLLPARSLSEFLGGRARLQLELLPGGNYKP